MDEEIDADTQFWLNIVERNKSSIADAIRRCSWSDDCYHNPRIHHDRIPIFPLRDCKLVFGKDDVREFAMVYRRCWDASSYGRKPVRSMENEVIAVNQGIIDGLLTVEKL